VSLDFRNSCIGRYAEENSPDFDQMGCLFRARTGDLQAFDTLVEPHLHRIYLTAKKITRNHEDAEDACQESMMKAFVHIQRFERNAKVSTWLTRIVINEALMKVRKMRVEARYRSDESDLFGMPLFIGLRDQKVSSDPEALCAQAERKALLWNAIDRLETKSPLASCALGLEERETMEVAEAIQLSRSGVRSRFQRALRKIRATIAEKLGGSLPLRVVEDKPQY
jgi:RNA polymerase sigma-70 factor, ECF subfamily